jgi:hypothetical protein
MPPRLKHPGWRRVSFALILTAGIAGPVILRAESIVPTLHATMRTMAASIAQIDAFAKGTGEQSAAIDAARNVIVLAKSRNC